MIGLKGQKVFVTGADGFIGSHLTEQLIEAGCQVTALAQYNAFDQHGWLDDLSQSHRDAIEIIKGDVRDEGQMRRSIKGQDIVFHLAALIAIPYSYHAPQSYVDVNVKGTTNILEASRDADVSRVIVTSTSETYGTAITTPMSESHPLQAQSPYAASKIAADMMAASYYKSFGLQTVILRPFNTYGPRQSERAVISSIIRQILDEDLDHIELGNLEPRRDFTFVEDTARAFLKASTSTKLEFAEPYNAGNGKAVSIGDLVNLLQEISGTNKPVKQSEERFRPDASEVMHLECDASKFKDITGWKAQISLRDGLQRTLDWRRKLGRKSTVEYSV